MQNLRVPVVHVAAKGSIPELSPQAAEKQGKITGRQASTCKLPQNSDADNEDFPSNDNDLTMTESDQGSSPVLKSYLDQQRDCYYSSPNMGSDSEIMSPEAEAAVARVSYGRPTATLTTARPSKKRASVPKNLLKELAAFNKDSVVETDPGITGLNARESHNTRRFVRSLNNLAAGSDTPVPPLDNLNWKRLEKEQLNPTRSRKNHVRSTSNAGSYKKEGNQEDFSDTPTMSVRSPRKVSGVRKDQENTSEIKRRNRLRKEGSDVWTLWRTRKDHILNLIRGPSLPDLNRLDEEDYQIWRSLVPNNFNMSREGDFFVFAPTSAELWNFPKFIAKIEDMIGRKRGFVKIILPDSMKSYYSPPHPTVTASSAAKLPFKDSSCSIRPYKTTLDLLAPFDCDTTPVYRVRMLGGVNVLISEWQEAMGKYQEEKMKEHSDKHSESPFHVRDAIDELLSTPRNEEELIADSKRACDDMYYTADIQESHSLRQALRLGGPYLRSIQGNRLQAPKFKELAMDRPKIQISGARGSPFGLEMTNHAAYSLNYLHRGAPKRWIIIEPDAHKKLEELLYPHVEAAEDRIVHLPSGFYKPPTHPPRCDRFLAHQPLYVPKDILYLRSIPYTELVQYEGEMVITFPFAYSQGFSAGPNLAETIGFGNERWEAIQNGHLYRPCHANCSGPKSPADPGQVEFSDIDQPSSSHISRHVPNFVLEEDEDMDSSPTAPESSGSDVGSDPEDDT